MKKHIIALYVNDPMGKRWLFNADAAGRAHDELGAYEALKTAILSDSEL